MKTSILIAAHNEGDNLLRTVKSCKESIHDLDYEIVIADDASSDHAVEEVLARFPEIQVVRHATRKGASPTKHATTTLASGDVFVFLDGHTKPTPGAIARLVEDVQLHEGRAIVVPAIAQLDQRTWENSSHLIGYGYGMNVASMKTYWLARSEMRTRTTAGRLFFESPSLIGCCFAMHRDLYAEILGMDSDMQQWGVEDLDLGMKAWLFDAPVLTDAEVVIGHRFRRTFDNFTVVHAHILANELRFARKHFEDRAWKQWLNARRSSMPVNAWQAGWDLFETNLASIETEMNSLQSRRVHDEYWYAEQFGLNWPGRDAESVPRGLAMMQMSGGNPSEMPSPEPSVEPSEGPSPCPGDNACPEASIKEIVYDPKRVLAGHVQILSLEAEYDNPTDSEFCKFNDANVMWTIASVTWKKGHNDIPSAEAYRPNTTMLDGNSFSFAAIFPKQGLWEVEVELKVIWNSENKEAADAAECSCQSCESIVKSKFRFVVVDPNQIDIQITAFIPFPHVEAPLYGTFEGDGNGFSFRRDSFRIRHTIHINPSSILVTGPTSTKNVGVTRSYDPATSIDPVTGELTPAAKADMVKGAPMMIGGFNFEMHGFWVRTVRVVI
ncbi:glycosyltransferase [Rubinisphaera italica]|uniref:N-glycosyltransferase n=1 Tax=Rubinisphaera italica TaxID=2527969 RepID=A0A5C5XID0_9PLAN|nr:glycosyltransferase [Rubinisphaera italica]TWT62897.1 N-glycosyltransferase [Rubinisphaera italica]